MKKIRLKKDAKEEQEKEEIYDDGEGVGRIRDNCEMKEEWRMKKIKKKERIWARKGGKIWLELWKEE